MVPEIVVRRLSSGDAEIVDAALRRFAGQVAPSAEGFLSEASVVAFAALDGREVVGWLYGYEQPPPGGLARLEPLRVRSRAGIPEASAGASSRQPLRRRGLAATAASGSSRMSKTMQRARFTTRRAAILK